MLGDCRHQQWEWRTRDMSVVRTAWVRLHRYITCTPTNTPHSHSIHTLLIYIIYYTCSRLLEWVTRSGCKEAHPFRLILILDGFKVAEISRNKWQPVEHEHAEIKLWTCNPLYTLKTLENCCRLLKYLVKSLTVLHLPEQPNSYLQRSDSNA